MSTAISSPETGVPVYKSINKLISKTLLEKNLYLDLKPEYKNKNEYIQLKGKTLPYKKTLPETGVQKYK